MNQLILSNKNKDSLLVDVVLHFLTSSKYSLNNNFYLLSCNSKTTLNDKKLLLYNLNAC